MLQLVKELTPLRRIYQRYWIRRWIETHAEDFNRQRRTAGQSLSEADGPRVEALLVELATGGSEHALYELAIEQLVAQMNAAAQITLDYPKKYSDLLLVLSEGADVSDAAIVVNGIPSRKSAPPAKYLEARNRVGHRIQRNLDAIQITLGSSWKFWMQVTAITLSTLLIEAAVIGLSGGAKPSILLIALPIGIAGGYFAPVSRDLIAALQTLRK
jgi:hypothetical protein